MKHLIPLSEPYICGNEWKYVKECLDTGWVSSAGGYVNKFERFFSDYIGSKYSVAVVNGTSALHLSLLVCNVNAGDEVIVPTLTFIATANVVRYCNAIPVFMDSTFDTLGMDIDKVADFLKTNCKFKSGYAINKKTNRKIKAIIPVHIFGFPVDMQSLSSVCRQFNIAIVEDATESLGSELKGKKTGAFGDIGCFSFNGNKIITTGGGGMIVTADRKKADLIRHLSTQARSDSFEYDHDEIGYNYRLTNVQAAIGVAQMENLERYISLKRKNALLYKNLLSHIEQVELLWENPQMRSNFWLNTIKVPKKDKLKLLDFLLSNNIQARPIWKLIHTLPMYKSYQHYKIINAINSYETCINIPSCVNIKKREIEYIADKIRQYFKK